MALAQIVTWYRAFNEGEDMRAQTLEQIAQYSAGTRA